CGCFFQAEDGIRDFHVTGVQTCALPICESCGSVERLSVHHILPVSRWPELGWCEWLWKVLCMRCNVAVGTDVRVSDLKRSLASEIGRASCREGVEVAVAVGE